jgi:hypothetical protein
MTDRGASSIVRQRGAPSMAPTPVPSACWVEVPFDRTVAGLIVGSTALVGLVTATFLVATIGAAMSGDLTADAAVAILVGVPAAATVIGILLARSMWPARIVVRDQVVVVHGPRRSRTIEGVTRFVPRRRRWGWPVPVLEVVEIDVVISGSDAHGQPVSTGVWLRASDRCRADQAILALNEAVMHPDRLDQWHADISLPKPRRSREERIGIRYWAAITTVSCAALWLGGTGGDVVAYVWFASPFVPTLGAAHIRLSERVVGGPMRDDGTVRRSVVVAAFVMPVAWIGGSIVAGVFGGGDWVLRWLVFGSWPAVVGISGLAEVVVHRRRMAASIRSVD